MTGTVKTVNRGSAGVVLDQGGYLGRFEWSAKAGLPIRVSADIIEPIEVA